MQIQWYGQSAFRLDGGESSVFIDPFGDMTPLASGHGLQFDYPAIEGVDADVLIVTHEHLDHNGVEVIGGDPVTVRSTAGTHESPIGEVVTVASEHDDVAGTQRGANTIAVFTLDGLRIAHFGDFGQPALRPEQKAAIGTVDLAFVPVGGSATIDAAQAKALIDDLAPRWVVPMHYRTHRTNFLEPADAFVKMFDEVHSISESSFDTGALPAGDQPVAVVPAAP